MTRTSKALKRLGVAGLAVATIAGLATLPMGTASASHTGQATSVTITPNADTAAAGTCNPYRLDAFGNNTTAASATPVKAENTVIDVVVTEQDTDTATAGTQQSNTQDIDFCTQSTSTGNTAAENGDPNFTGTSVQPATGANQTDSGAAGGTDRAEFTTDANGTVYFGIVGNEAGGVDLLAFLDYNNNNVRDATEPQATATKTFVRGGTEAVNCVDATPETASNVVGETHTINVLLTDNNGGNAISQTEPGAGPGCATGNTIAGVTPTAVISSSTNANGPINPTPTTAISCTPSNNNGVSTCTYSSSAVRTDQIQVYVNQLDDPNGGTFNAGAEPGDVVSKSWQAAPTGLALDVTCTSGNPPANGTITGVTNGQTSPEDCVNTIGGGNTATFTASVSNATTGGTQTTSGIIVRFTVSGGSGDETIVGNSGNNECTTGGAAGSTTANTCTVTVTDPTPASGEKLTVTGTIAGTSVSDSGTLTFTGATSTARNFTLTPQSVTAAPGGVATLTGNVTDASGNPVAGVTVTFSEGPTGGQNGAGFIRGVNGSQGALSGTTDLNGNVTVELSSGPAEQGQTTVVGTITTAGTQCGNAAGTPAGTTTAGNCTDSSVVTFGTATTSPTTTTTSSPGQCASPASVSIAVNVQRITSGNAPTLSGFVRDAAGNALSGCSMTLFAKNYIQTSYSPITTSTPIVTDDQGRFVVVVRPERQTSYIARVTNTQVQSRSLVIFVSTRVNLNRPAAGQVLPRTFCFTGNLDPNAQDLRGAAVGLAKVGRDAQGRPTFAVIGQTLTRNDAEATFTVCPKSGSLASGTYVVFTSARNGLLKGSVSQAVTTR